MICENPTGLLGGRGGGCSGDCKAQREPHTTLKGNQPISQLLDHQEDPAPLAPGAAALGAIRTSSSLQTTATVNMGRS